MKILVVEDDVETLEFVKKGLCEEGHSVDSCANGQEGLLMASTSDYDLIVLDRMLPGLDGLSVVRTLRANSSLVPILILSALSEVDQRVEGLEAGCDDYLIKPFAFSELKARCNILMKRPKASDQITLLETASLKMDLVNRKVTRGETEIDLKPREFRLLEFLLRHAGEVVTRTMLLEHVWDYHFDPQTNVIDVHVSRLRNKLDKDFSNQLLETVRGAGYRLSKD